MYCVILCGGSGTRLWPLSRKNFPKQFLSLLGDKSLLQETYSRSRKNFKKENIIFVTNNDNYFNVLNQIKEIEKDFNGLQILKEPESKNTAPAITFAVKYLVEVKKADLNSPVLVASADHYIKNENDYVKLLNEALNNIGENIGAIGIVPLKPETGYGYIKKGSRENNYFKAEEFKEKPDKETAEKYLRSGEYLWNAGIFIFKIKTFASELKKNSPEIYSALIKPFNKFLNEFTAIPNISFDYAIAEKSSRMIVFEGNFGWSDIGSFDSLSEIMKGTEDKKHIHIDSKNIFVHSAGNRLVATLGVEDLIIIENNDSILIQKKGRSEDIRKIVKHLNDNNYKEAEHNLVVHRPWGKFEVLMDEPGYKVKKITVYPNAKLSLQAHYHRVEHWIVVRGTAEIVNGNKKIILKENESTFIPSLAKHRLENPGKTNLEIIEVQTGGYLEEDDIIRYDDVYKRKN